MGTCCNTQHDQQQDDDCKTHKILFLGSGGCGKSTTFKQLRKLYGEGWTIKQKNDAIHGIAANVVHSMQTLLEDENINIDEFKDQDTINAAKNILSIGTNTVYQLNEEMAESIKLLWSQQIIKDTFFNEIV